MRLFAQIDGDVVTGLYEGEQAPSKVPDGRSFVELEDVVPLLSTYDRKTKAFTPPAPVETRRLSKADVIGSLTPEQWAEMNKFHPTAVGTSANGIPYNDPEVFWAVSVFNAAARDFALNDDRLVDIVTRLIGRRVLSERDGQALQGKLAEVAR